jgi:hypothetical protein
VFGQPHKGLIHPARRLLGYRKTTIYFAPPAHRSGKVVTPPCQFRRSDKKRYFARFVGSGPTFRQDGFRVIQPALVFQNPGEFGVDPPFTPAECQGGPPMQLGRRPVAMAGGQTGVVVRNRALMGKQAGGFGQ